jgi:hypothetical protein
MGWSGKSLGLRPGDGLSLALDSDQLARNSIVNSGGTAHYQLAIYEHRKICGSTADWRSRLLLMSCEIN